MGRVATLAAEAARLGVTPPTPPTLRRYGLTSDGWLRLLAEQGWACGVCKRRVAQWNIDHDHVPGWKAMPPQQRVRYVRGVLCVHCNYRLVPSRMTHETAQAIADYIERYERRRDAL